MLTKEQLLTYHVEKNHQNNTKSRYRGVITHWNRLGIGDPTDEALAHYRDTRLGEGAARDTVRGELTKAVAMAVWLGFPGVVKKPRKVERCPEAWNHKQLRQLFREARTTVRVVWSIPGRLFWPALLGVAYDTGERIGAIAQIGWEEIDLDAGTIYYPAEVRKGGYRDARASLSRDTVRALRAFREAAPPNATVFEYGCRTRLWQAYGALLRDAGLPDDRRSKFHRLRRTHATFVYAAGGDATAALGHSTDAVTRKSYIDWNQIRKRLPWRPWFGW
jgi:integrase